MNRIVGLGMDLADLDRVRQALQKNGETFALRICTQDEWAYCRKHADPVPRLAARFAAKEAVAKALGTGIGEKCAFTDVEVVRNDAGAPVHSPARLCRSDGAGAEHYRLASDHDPFPPERRRHCHRPGRSPGIFLTRTGAPQAFAASGIILPGTKPPGT